MLVVLRASGTVLKLIDSLLGLLLWELSGLELLDDGLCLFEAFSVDPDSSAAGWRGWKVDCDA